MLIEKRDIANGTSARGRAMPDALLVHFDITVVCIGRWAERHEEVFKRTITGSNH